jgi:hypothetical protein
MELGNGADETVPEITVFISFLSREQTAEGSRGVRKSRGQACNRAIRERLAATGPDLKYYLVAQKESGGYTRKRYS